MPAKLVMRINVETLVLMAFVTSTPPLGAAGADFLGVVVSMVSLGVRTSVLEP